MKRLMLAARALFTACSLVVSVFCLLAYLPFTYHHAGNLMGWPKAAAAMHPWWNLAVVALLLALLREPWRHGGWPRRMAAALAFWQCGSGVALIVHPVLPNLRNDGSSLAYSLAALLAPAWLAAVDIASWWKGIQWTGRRPHAAHFAAAWRSAIFVTSIFAALALARSARLAPSDAAAAIGGSLLVHMLIFLAIFLLLDWLARVAGLFRASSQAAFCLCHVLTAAAVWEVVETVVCPAAGFAGWPAFAYAAALALVVALQNAAAALYLAHGSKVDDGVGLALSAPAFGLARSPAGASAFLLVLAAAGGYAVIRVAAMDWNFLLQELLAAAIWMGAFACFYSPAARRACSDAISARSARGGLLWLALPLVAACAWRGLEARQSSGPVLEKWAGYDASFRLARVILARPADGDGSFDRFLAHNTNIASSVRVDPVPVVLSANLARSTEARPHIFIFTIDSLRRDYLSPYNPAVTFTPAMDAFARESTVFRNAFTRYGGTGLAEPSIWTGALLLHKQYITPFAPMNALERLLEVDGYRMFVSRDSILHTILEPSPDAVELDLPEAVRVFEFSRSLEKLAEAIDRRAPGDAPIFAYTQPQNLHISTIRREGAAVPPGETYPGFYAPYAARLRRMDAAFGNFIAFLKARGLYDQSIVVLTADHGDSLGEDGRWGHAYTLFPEIVRIPLIVRLPPSLAARVSSDPGAPAFSTDITPSLYYLLGHRPVARHELFGSPLFTETPAERRPAGGPGYLIAASYGPVYGMLSADGRALYVADAVNYRRYRFDLSAPGAREEAPGDTFRREQDEKIRAAILSIHRFYRFGEGGKVLDD